MSKRKPKAAIDPRPEKSFYPAVRSLGLHVVSYLTETVECRDGTTYWLPRDLIGSDGKTMIVHRSKMDGIYSIDGWEPWHDGMFGGRYETIYGALNWVNAAKEVRAGVRKDFRGV